MDLTQLNNSTMLIPKAESPSSSLVSLSQQKKEKKMNDMKNKIPMNLMVLLLTLAKKTFTNTRIRSNILLNRGDDDFTLSTIAFLQKYEQDKESHINRNFNSSRHIKSIDHAREIMHNFNEFRDMSDDQIQQLIHYNPKKNSKRDMLRKEITTFSNEPKKNLNTISPCVQRIVLNLNLFDEPNYYKRAYRFIAYCRIRNYSGNTVQNYFNQARMCNVFGSYDFIKQVQSIQDNGTRYQFYKKFLNHFDNNPPVISRPDKFMFNGREHNRLLNPDQLLTFAIYLSEHVSLYNLPIITVLLSLLRISEMLSMTLKNLRELSEYRQVVTIKRKNTSPLGGVNYYQPYYHPGLKYLITILTRFFQRELHEYDKNPALNRRLFFITPYTVNERLKAEFYLATGQRLQHGQGCHSFRTTMATILYNDGVSFYIIQKMLGHKEKSKGATKAYIHKFNVRLNLAFQKLLKENNI